MLPIHGSLDRVRENFAGQFTPETEGFIYRRRQRGEAILVTTVERDRFVAYFNRALRRLFWGGVASLIAAMALFEIWPAILPAALRPWHEAIVAAGATIVFATIWERLSSAPDRALGWRAVVAAPLDAAARWRVNFAGLLWGVLVFGALLMRP